MIKKSRRIPWINVIPYSGSNLKVISNDELGQEPDVKWIDKRMSVMFDLC